ncbi:restriction endonuclease subunit S [Clavibacter sp. DM3]|nr:restriction endonuclease subunit S [Clavibacter zhangzhiyongii]
MDLARLTYVNASVDEVSKYTVHNGDLLLNTRNSRELVGKSAIFHGLPCLYNNNISRIRFTEQVDSRYIHAFLWSREGRRQLESRKSGTTNVVAMYAKDFATISVPVPDLEEQQAFSAMVAAVDIRRIQVRRSLQLDDSLFASLQARAFRGEL